MTIDEARKHYKEGKFPPGSMGPKILTAIEFIEETGKDVIVTLLEKIKNTISRHSGESRNPVF